MTWRNFPEPADRHSPRAMRILHLIYDHPENPWVGGGGAIRALELNRRLQARGHVVTVLSGAFPGASDGILDGLEFRFTGSASGYIRSTLTFAYMACRYARAHAGEFDIVVEDFAPWNPVFSYRLVRPPAVLHVNHCEGLNILKRRPLSGLPFFLIEKYYPPRFSHVTALSEWTRRKVGVENSFVLPAGIGADLVEEGRSSALPQAEREDYVVYLGRLEINNKGLDTLVDAARKLGGIRILVAGRGRDERRLRDMASGLPVEFLGFVTEKEKRNLLRKASLFVLPSRFEGWGISVLEAAAFGTPAVVSDIPELGYALEGGFGRSFRTGDPEDLARVMGGLYSDRGALGSMGLRGVEFASSHNWDSIALVYEKYLQGIVSAGVN